MRAYSTFQQAKEEFGSDYGINNSEFSYFVESVEKLRFSRMVRLHKLEKKCLNNQNLETVRAITLAAKINNPIFLCTDLRTQVRL